MVERHYTATVREDSKGQKSVTVPKDSDLSHGDTIKLKKTQSWAYSDFSEALEQARKDAAEKWFRDDNLLSAEDVGFTVFHCKKGEGRNICFSGELREDDIIQHLKEAHDLDDNEISEEDYVELWSISETDLCRLFPFIIRKLDLENRDLHADNVANRIEEIVTDDNLTDPIKLEKLHDYAQELMDNHYCRSRN
jgi:hypothetical protein